MSRQFSDSGSEVRCSIGAFSGANGGGETYAFIVKRSAGTNVDNIFAFLGSDGLWAGCAIQNGFSETIEYYYTKSPSVSGSQSPTGYYDAANDWTLLVVSKAAGSAVTRWHRYIYSTATWTHVNGSGSVADSTVLPGASGVVQFGRLQTVDPMNGLLAVAGGWLRVLSDAEVETLPLALSAWADLNPDGLWAFNQASTATAVTDLSGNGADQVSTTGTSVSADEPPGFDYSLAGSVTGSLNATVPALTGGMSGTVSASGVSGSLDATLPALAGALTGTVETPPTPPTVTAGRARPVVNGGGVLLDVVATPPGGESITGHSWQIISGGGSLTNATTATPTYTAPASGNALAVIRDTVTASGGGTASADVTVSYHATVVAAENALTGTPRATWDLPTTDLGGIATLQGFCDGFTANRDETANFKIAQSDGAGWSAEVFRLGYYGGNGARSYGTLAPSGAQLTSSQSQPAPLDADASTTKLSADCSNWATTLTWTPPSWAPSGMYVLRLNRTGGGASHVMFILRDDARTADLMVMPSDSTWNAYNAFGGMGSANWLAGNSLYFGTTVNQYDTDCARFVSYNRPVVNRAAQNVTYGAVEWSNFFTGEYPMLRFLERNGIDAKYYGCIDAAGDPTGAKLANVGAAMMIGHNEYWSDGMRAGWEAAKAAGTNIFSCAANECFWRLVGTELDGAGRPRTWECQKSTINGRGNTRPEWTGTWRDPDGAGKGGDNPENLLTGTIFVVNGPDLRALVVPKDGGYADQPLWRHTSVAALAAGQSYSSPSQIIGFEWDTYGPAGCSTTGADFLADPHPQARYCSNMTANVTLDFVLTDAGDVYGPGTVTHRCVVTPNGPNGGITFGTGTINWALGVDNANTYQQGNDNTAVQIQQATINMLVDMGAAPATLMAGLTEPTPESWFPVTATLNGTLPALTADMSGAASVTGGLAGTLPVLTVGVAGTVTATGALDGQLPALTADLTGVATVTGSLDGSLPAIQSVLAGNVGDDVAGSVTGVLPAMQAGFAASVTVSGDLSGALPAMHATLDSQVRSGTAGVLDGQLPALLADLAGEVTVDAVLAAAIPSLLADLTGALPVQVGAMTNYARRGPQLEPAVRAAPTMTGGG